MRSKGPAGSLAATAADVDECPVLDAEDDLDSPLPSAGSVEVALPAEDGPLVAPVTPLTVMLPFGMVFGMPELTATAAPRVGSSA